MSLKVFFRWCVVHGHMTENFTDGIERPRLNRPLPKSLSKEEANRLLEVVYNFPYENDFLRFRNHAIFAMFMYAGLRKSELLKLRMQDVDVKNMTIFVRYGKGAKDRVVPMTHTLATILKYYLEQRKKWLKTCPEFFTSSKLNQRYTDSGLKRLKRKITQASQIKFTIHGLRHTFATLMAEGGCDPFSLKDMMGHADIKTTMLYVSMSALHMRSQVSKHPMESQETSVKPAVLDRHLELHAMGKTKSQRF